MAMKISKVCVTTGTVQLQFVETNAAAKSALQRVVAPPANLLIGSQNT